jgi:hypothetical protein
MHPDLELLAPLMGTWEGEGRGEYPTIDSFSYTETMRFADTGKRFLVYSQRTADAITGTGLHVETGYWRPAPPDRVEVTIAHPMGQTELAEGTVDGGRFELRSITIANATTAKRVELLERSFVVDGDTLRYEMRMAAEGVPLTHHLAAELHRTDR